jgi:homoserine kinase
MTETGLVQQHVRVKVPATSANIGSGFDILGLALQLYNTFTVTVTSASEWSVSLPPGIRLPTRDDNLVWRAARQLFDRVGVVPTGLHLSLDLDVPLGRGLGSSASAIVGGLVGANAMTGNRLDRDTLLAMAVALEGHPDNVTPALIGGMTLSYTLASEHRYVALPVPENVQIIVAIPDFQLSTAKARAVLPSQVSRDDAIFNSSRTALLVAALYERRYDWLAAAMDDRLHQPYRASLVPGMTEAIAAGYAARALGVALSGAGPTLIALAQDDGDAVATALRHAFAQRGVSCETRLLRADTEGAVVVDAVPEWPFK